MSSAAARGAMLVVIGLALGAFILGQGFDGPGVGSSPDSQLETTGESDPTEVPTEVPVDGDASPEAPATDDTAEEGGDEPGVELTPEEGAPADDPTVLTPTTRPPSEVKVLVANGSGVQGAAGAATATLLGTGYNALSPVNGEPQSETRIYFEVGFDADAQAVAQLLSAGPDRLAPMIDPPPGGVDLRGANILVLLGPDEVAQPG